MRTASGLVETNRIGYIQMSRSFTLIPARHRRFGPPPLYGWRPF